MISASNDDDMLALVLLPSPVEFMWRSFSLEEVINSHFLSVSAVLLLPAGAVEAIYDDSSTTNHRHEITTDVQCSFLQWK